MGYVNRMNGEWPRLEALSRTDLELTLRVLVEEASAGQLAGPPTAS